MYVCTYVRMYACTYVLYKRKVHLLNGGVNVISGQLIDVLKVVSQRVQVST